MTRTTSAFPGQQSSKDERRLPKLREDLLISLGPTAKNESVYWIVNDPLQNRYFRIDATTKLILDHWQPGLLIQEFVQKLDADTKLSFCKHAVEGLIAFIQKNRLVADDGQNWRQLAKQAEGARNKSVAQRIHSYLFLKFPLAHPERTLARLLPLVEPLYSWWTVRALGFLGLVGLYLTSRQWDIFVSTFNQYNSLAGALYFATAIVVLKALHELGHAFTALRFGCRVPTIGVALILLFPLLYTDVSDAWRLRSRRERLAIGAAGIIVEISLATIALFLWAFLPDGIFRSLAFVIATSSLALTLAINLNPFMKFDGYYLLADYLEIDNLQSRAFALGRWQIRKFIFAPQLEPPENFGSHMQRLLIAYAWLTWLYRLVVFTTIVLLVYNYCFKLLGLILLAVEIWYLLLRPIVAELRDWLKVPDRHVSTRRIAISTCGFFLIVGFFGVPWSSAINAPAILEAAQVAQVYPPRAGRVKQLYVSAGARVDEGDILLALDLPKLDHQLLETATELEVTRLRLASVARSDLDETLVLRSKLEFLETKLQGLSREKEELVIRAPIAGTLQEFNREAHVGRWIGQSDQIAFIVSSDRQNLKAYVAESDYHRIRRDAVGTFVPEDITRPSVRVKLTQTTPVGVRSIDIEELASRSGGPIAVELDQHNRLVPVSAQYLMNLEPTSGPLDFRHVVRGVVALDATSESLFAKGWKQIIPILMRESGF